MSEVRKRTVAVEDVDESKNFNDIVKEIKEFKENESPTCAYKISLHSKVELLRLRLEESEDEGNKKLLTEIENITTEEDYTKKIRLTGTKSFTALGVLRYISCLLFFFFFSFPLVICLFPLRFLNPLLRKLNIHNNSLPSDYVLEYFAKSVIFCFGVTIRTEGLENIEDDQNYVCMFTHASNLDPFILQAACPIAFKWIGKKEIMYIPVFGFLFWSYGNIFIDRSNKTRAIESLNNAVRKIHKYKRSIAISPEGTRSRTGQLRPFKKGPFHTTKQAGLPILPVVLLAAYDRWPPGQLYPTPGVITVRFLKPLPYDKDMAVEDSLSKTRKAILTDMSIEEKLPNPKEGQPSQVQLIILFLTHVVIAVFIPFLWYSVYRFIF